MRLVAVNQKLGYSSTTSYAFELLRALRARGHNLRLCTVGGQFREVFKAEGIDYLQVRSNFFSFRKLMQFLAEFDPQLIHIHNLKSLSMGIRISERLNKHHIVTVHRIPSGVHAGLRNRYLAGVIAANEAVREALVNDQRVPKELIRVVRNGVQLDRFVPGDPPLSSGKMPVIGAIGSLEPLKGYPYLLSAARKVVDQGREAMFVIVGDGSQESALRRQIKELGLEKHTTLCPPLPDLAEIIRNFDIVVVPTLRGGVGLTAVEAMAMARPVVASAVGEILQIISDGTTGILVGERDSDAIAEKIIHLLDHPNEAREVGSAARDWVEGNLSLNPMVDATEQFYQDVIEEKTGVESASSSPS